MLGKSCYSHVKSFSLLQAVVEIVATIVVGATSLVTLLANAQMRRIIVEKAAALNVEATVTWPETAPVDKAVLVAIALEVEMLE